MCLRFGFQVICFANFKLSLNSKVNSKIIHSLIQASWGHLLSVGVHSSYRAPLWPFCSMLFYSVLCCNNNNQPGASVCSRSIPQCLIARVVRSFIRADVELKSISQLVISASINVASDKASALMCPLNSHTHTEHTHTHTCTHTHNMHHNLH